MKLDLNFINYEAIVAELSKSLRSFDHPMVKAAGFDRTTWLSENRTIGFRTGRQTGSTGYIFSGVKDPKTALVIFGDVGMAEVFKLSWPNARPGEPLPVCWVGPFYPKDDAGRRGIGVPMEPGLLFEQVFVDDAMRYFSSWKYAKTYKALNEVVSNDVVITLID